MHSLGRLTRHLSVNVLVPLIPHVIEVHPSSLTNLVVHQLLLKEVATAADLNLVSGWDSWSCVSHLVTRPEVVALA